MPTPLPSRTVTSGRIEVGDLCLAYRRAGAGPPLVLLHGGLADSRVWSWQLEDLSAEFSVVAWDAPGCGDSSDPPDTFRLADYADCLAGFIGALHLERPYVLGHSFGGGLALELYARHRLLPRALILAGGYAGWAGSLPPEEVERRLQAALEVARLEPGRVGSALASAPPTDSTGADPSLGPGAIASDVHPIGIRVMAFAFAQADLRDVLPLIDVPTLLLHGEIDERAPLRVVEHLHDGIRGSELVILPGAGHESYQDAPRLFNTEVRRFLRSIRD